MTTQPDTRAVRLAQALRDNLRRRKAQARAIDADVGETNAAGKTATETDQNGLSPITLPPST